MSDREAQSEDLRQFVSFVVAGEEFGVNILSVQEIIRPKDITRVPQAPDMVMGVINLRGRIIPVIDLRTCFGFPNRSQNADRRILVTEIEDRVVGFMTDSVREVLRVDVTTVEPAPELAVGIDGQYLRGVAKLEDRLLILLDLKRILSDEEAAALKGFGDGDAGEPVESTEQEPAAQAAAV